VAPAAFAVPPDRTPGPGVLFHHGKHLAPVVPNVAVAVHPRRSLPAKVPGFVAVVFIHLVADTLPHPLCRLAQHITVARAGTDISPGLGSGLVAPREVGTDGRAFSA
jgi:hypothetical protein